MKKLLSLTLALIMLLGLMPGVYAADITYGAVTALNDGKEYVLVWNSDIRGNAGDKHSLAATDSEIKTNHLSNSNITASQYAPTSEDNSEVWVALLSGGNWMFKNKQTGVYLKYDPSGKKLTVTSELSDATVWLYKSHTDGYSIQPFDYSDMSIRYSVGSKSLQMRAYNDGNNCHVFVYEAGAESCLEHKYKDCLETVCTVCGTQRDRTGLAHNYDGNVCTECGYEKYVYSNIALSDNEASKTFTAVFYDNNADSIATDESKNAFNLTSLIASVAPLESVTHIDITLEASNVDTFTNPFNSKPSCELYWNGWWNKFVERKKFGDENVVTFSADIPEEGVDSIWLLPFAFVPETDITFRITVTVTYNETSDTDYGEPIASIVSFSDYQMWSGSQKYATNWIALRAQFSDILTTMSRVNPDYVIFGGDYTSYMLGKEASDYGRAEILDILSQYWPHISPDNGTYIQVEGNHDPNTQIDYEDSHLVEYDDFLVYILNEDDLPWDMYTESYKELATATASKLTACFDKLIAKGETRPVFIASHTGLHYDAARDDGNNQYAYIVFDAINEAAEDLDIIFMFGHNHSTGDPEVGGSVVFRAVGDTLYVPTEDCYDKSGKGYNDRLNIGRASTLNFTYLNYGYIGYLGARLANTGDFATLNPETVLTVSEINIYDDVITLSRYSAGGKISAFGKTISRLHTEVAENTEKTENSGYISTGDSTHMIIIDGNPITSEHVYNDSGICIYCGYQNNSLEESEVVVDEPAEPISETSGKNTPWVLFAGGTGAIVIVVTFAAVLVRRKRS